MLPCLVERPTRADIWQISGDFLCLITRRNAMPLCSHCLACLMTGFLSVQPLKLCLQEGHYIDEDASNTQTHLLEHLLPSFPVPTANVTSKQPYRHTHKRTAADIFLKGRLHSRLQDNGDALWTIAVVGWDHPNHHFTLKISICEEVAGMQGADDHASSACCQQPLTVFSRSRGLDAVESMVEVASAAVSIMTTCSNSSPDCFSKFEKLLSISHLKCHCQLYMPAALWALDQRVHLKPA